MQILVSIGTVGASSHIDETLPPCDFFDYPVLSCPDLFFSILYAQVEPLNQFWRCMAQTNPSSNDVFSLKDGRSGVKTTGGHIWGNMPQPSLRPDGREQAILSQNGEIKNRNISKTINRIMTKFQYHAETKNCASWVI